MEVELQSKSGLGIIVLHSRIILSGNMKTPAIEQQQKQPWSWTQGHCNDERRWEGKNDVVETFVFLKANVLIDTQWCLRWNYLI